jgi:hypothetical protein
MAKLLIMKMGTLLLTKEHGKTLDHENGNTLINQEHGKTLNQKNMAKLSIKKMGGQKILFKIMGFFILREWENSKL